MKKFIVISHTHWDREWYLPFERFRLKLVDLIDNLFGILQEHPDYIFHLDAQTVVLDDYLELRPSRRELLEKYISSGNLIVGPWYLQNDFYLTSGESTVRNLLIGRQKAEAFGRCSEVGYAPDQFGNIPQLPQILAGFGIDNFVFGRGYRIYELKEGKPARAPLPAEFRWRGADGSECLAIFLQDWYNNAQHIPEDPELAELLLRINLESFEQTGQTPYVLLMNGVDHLEAQADVLDVLAMLRGRGYDIEQYSLDRYVSEVREHLKPREESLSVLEGALLKGGDYDLLRGCWSSRIYLKVQNVRAQEMLERQLEPLYSYLESSGMAGVQPKHTLDDLCTILIRNQPHDSICGCSCDPVHRHMEDRTSRFFEIGDELLRRGMETLALHTASPYRGDDRYVIALFNPTGRHLSRVVEAELNFPSSEAVEEFELFGPDGESLPYEVLSRRNTALDVFSPLNLPGVLDVNRVRIRFQTQAVPPLCSREYAVIPHRKGRAAERGAQTDCLENEFCRISFQSGGIVLEKLSGGERILDALFLEDTADKGDAYVYRKAPARPLIFRPTGFHVVESSIFRQKAEILFDLTLPSCYDFERDERSADTVRQQVRVTVTLDRGNPVPELDYTFLNAACDHRLRLGVRFTVGARVVSDSPFAFGEYRPGSYCPQTESETFCNTSFVSAQCGSRRLTLYTEGQHEAEYDRDVLYLTLVRATGYINRDCASYRPVGGAQWKVPENQCLRELSGRLGLDLRPDLSYADCYSNAAAFRSGLLVHATSFDRRKYSGGRFAVQSSRLERLYYQPDPYAERTVRREPEIAVEGEAVVFTAYKAAERGGRIVRLLNFSDREQRAVVSCVRPMHVTDLAEREESPAGTRYEITLRPMQLLTLRIEAGGE